MGISVQISIILVSVLNKICIERNDCNEINIFYLFVFCRAVDPITLGNLKEIHNTKNCFKLGPLPPDYFWSYICR